MPENLYATLRPEPFALGQRRGVYWDVSKVLNTAPAPIDEAEVKIFEAIDLAYRTLCGILYNFVPTSGHPGGSISSGRIVEALLYQTMRYDFSTPDAPEADTLVYAAGHKAMGLYAMWALRNELVRIARPDLLPDATKQLRLEDLLGFRRNPTNATPLFKKFRAKALDGHPTPATPFVRIATGASGVGVPAAFGLAMAALDTYRDTPPFVHLLEGEGGMTPGRVHEALAAAATARLHNTIMHVDWNQASIDSNRVCRSDGEPGDYVQWNPMELLYLHDWNVIFVPEGWDFRQIFAAQELALTFETQQPTAIVYRTIKGWKYGVEGKGSHGAGHKFCSEGYYGFLREFENYFDRQFPRFSDEPSPENVEQNFHDTLMTVRDVLQQRRELATIAAERIAQSRQQLQTMKRRMSPQAPNLQKLYAEATALRPEEVPPALQLKPGASVTLREVLGNALNVINQHTGGAVIGAAADLLGSTSIANLAKGFPEGLYNAVSNPGSRLIAVGGICEDAMGAFMAGLASFGNHVGATSSYGAFIGALEHVAARLHGIGQQTKFGKNGPYQTFIMINAHAGIKTGEDGPTHADPQVLQLLQENFPDNVLITLTPWDAQEIWPLLIAGLQARPAVLAPFVTRPPDPILDRAHYKLPPATAAVQGVYAMRQANLDAKVYHGTIVLQGNGVASAFVREVLPQLDEDGLNLNVYYVASVELFNRLSPKLQERIFPEPLTYEAMGITDFTLPTMYRFVRSREGLRRTLHSFRDGHYLGSGQAQAVLHEGGLDAAAQLAAIRDYAGMIEKKAGKSTAVFFASDTPEEKWRAPEVPKTMLVCASCGAQVEPAAYFASQPLPSNEICAVCERRSRESCAYCMAFWLNENPAIKFLCAKCANAGLMDGNRFHDTELLDDEVDG
jgi:transketolase